MADHIPLARDATLRDVVPTLNDAVNFVADAYRVINRHERMHGPVILRLGVSRISKGKRPNYRIDAAQTKEPIEAIDGNNHKPWPDGTSNLTNDWSTKWLTHAEVRALLGELRLQTGIKGSS
jgi:hypothetical protein